MTIDIPTETIKKKFNSFLNIERNSRILFSGKFGVGKTHFLQKFSEEENESYEVFHLFPVNYQINKEEDIINLVKYDILVELIKKDKNIFEENRINGIKDSSLLFWTWVSDRYTSNDLLQKIISTGEEVCSLSPDPIINVLSKIGRPLKDLLEIDKEFQKFKDEYKKGDKGLIEEYLKSIQNISEPDYISYLIKDKILKKKGDKKSILILDDLDRVDPEHIFRLLNLLSSFFEREEENRFGFDSIIIVADYSNLKYIFHHKFGKEADFSGYIDKFFSIAPYYFDNRKAIIDAVDTIVKNTKNENPILNNAISDSGYIKYFLVHIFSRAVEIEKINLREIFKLSKFQFLEFKKDGYHEDRFGDDDIFKEIFDIGVNVAILSFANINNFINVLEKIKESNKKTEIRMPFKKYITFMVKSLNLKTEEAIEFYWDKYQIRWIKESDSYLEVVSGGNEENLFYDLLIKYTKDRITFNR